MLAVFADRKFIEILTHLQVIDIEAQFLIVFSYYSSDAPRIY